MNLTCSQMRAAMLVVLLAFCAGIGSQTASAAIVVGTCTTGQQYATIQAAINAAPPGAVIRICPGQYPEQLTITKNLTLTGLLVMATHMEGILIESPSGGLTATVPSLLTPGDNIAAHVAILGTSGSPISVNLNNIVVDSYGNGIANPSSYAPGTNVVGILYQDANGTANHVTTHNQIADKVFNGDQGGFGFYVETDTSGIVVTLENSSVHDYNKNGVVAKGMATLNVLNSYVTGAGPTTTIAQNGIEYVSGATGKVSGNHVTGHQYTGIPPASASGILFYGAGTGSAATPIVLNDVTQNDFGIALFSDDGYTVTRNAIGHSTSEGVEVCSNNNTISLNRIFDSGEAGIDLDETCPATGNSVLRNTAVEACAGVLGDDTTNTIGVGTYFDDVYTFLNSASCQPPAMASAFTATTNIAGGASRSAKHSPSP